jgi:hypothetical protein
MAPKAYPAVFRYFPVATTIAIFLFVIGMAGFAQLELGRLPHDWEIPNSLQSVKVTAPDERVFVASAPTGRVQRYGPNGFERGFKVDSHGGHFEIGVAPSGDIVVCSTRGRARIVYDRDGIERGERGRCETEQKNRGLLPSPVYRPLADVPVFATSWIAALAVPLWHPFAAGLVALIGMLMLGVLGAGARIRPGRA